MKNILILLIIASYFLSLAQRNKLATMEPILTDGYYVTLKGDTVRGKVQVNPPGNEDFYKQFYFKDQRSKKPKLVIAQRVKAYGFEGKDFVMANLNRKKVFIERLTQGRLCFYEYRYSDGDMESELQTVYYIKDTQPESTDQELMTLKKLSPKFYKKNLKPFMKDQPTIWNNLDKYSFNEQNVISAVNHFNSYYPR